MALSVWPAPEDAGVVGPTGATGPAGSTGAPGAPGVVQSVNGKNTAAVVLNAADVNALPSNANATLNANELKISAAAGTYRTMGWQTSGVHRWLMLVDNAAESGGNAGSNFHITARDDAGGWISTVMHGTRATGQVTFGGEAPHGSAQTTVSGALGLRDIGADPTTASSGVFLYSKGGVPFFKNADGTSFQIMPGSAPVTSVNGHTGAVTLGASDVAAVPTTGGTITGHVKISGAGATNRELSLATDGVKRWTIQADSSPEGINPDGGSDFRIVSHANDGAQKNIVLAVKRGTNQAVFGDGPPIGWARVTTNGPHGIGNIDWEPETDGGGVQFYSQDGVPYVKRGNGTVFELYDGIPWGAYAAPLGVATLNASGVIPIEQVPNAARNTWTPQALGFRAWSVDPAAVANPTTLRAATVQRLYFAGMNITEPTSVSKVVVFSRGWAGSAAVPGARFVAGIYNQAGSRIAWTGGTPLSNVPAAGLEAGTPNDASGAHVGAVPFALSGGAVVLQPGRYWAAFLLSAGSATDFYYFHVQNEAPSNPSNFHLLGTAFMRAGYLATQTTLPDTITPSTMRLNHDPMIMALA